MLPWTWAKWLPPPSHCLYARSKHSGVKLGEKTRVLSPQKGPWAGSNKAEDEQYHGVLSRLKDFTCLSSGKKFTSFVPFS